MLIENAPNLDTFSTLLLADLATVVAGPIGPSALLLGLMGQPGSRLSQLACRAMPQGQSIAQLVARVGARLNRNSDRDAIGTSTLTARALNVLANYRRCCEDGRPASAELLLACIAIALQPDERQEWHPLDLDLLLAACESKSDDATPVSPQASIPRWSHFPPQNLTEQSRELNDLHSPFDASPVHEPFFDGVFRALHRGDPRHLLIIREVGVGEDAVLLELARRARNGPIFLRKRQFIKIDCRYVLPQELKGAIDSFLMGNLADEFVLCLDGFRQLLAASVGLDGSHSILAAALSRTRHRVVGMISPQETEEYFSSHAELSGLFNILTLPEPDLTTAQRLVHHYAKGLEKYYKVCIENEAIERAVVLCDSYILHDRLPAKAVKVLRAVCDDLDYDRSQHQKTTCTVTSADVLTKLAQVTGIPATTLAGLGEGVNYRQGLERIIVGQDHAVSEVSTELGLIKAGMVDSGKPASVMMFVGQTGTGKTEMAKALARLYSSSKRLKTFTLGNYSEPHSVSGIIGVPAGYVGHERGGRLVNELNTDPYGVFLLDEADKAHPDVMQPFLNLFDEGWICDQRGKKAFANRAIFILTTNVGQRQISDMCKSNKPMEEITSMMKDLLSRIRHTKSNRPVFTTEFLARVKRFIIFRTLDQAAMVGISHRVTADLCNEWRAKRRKTLSIPDSLQSAIGLRAFELDDKSQGREGGRMVRKLIADIIESKIQRAISENPDSYRLSGQVCVDHLPSGQATPQDLSLACAVRFE